MKCPKCGSEIAEGNKFCSNCGEKLFSDNTVQNTINDSNAKGIADKKIPFFLQMWFIILVLIISMAILGIPGFILFIIRIVKFPERRKGACIGLVAYVAIWSILVAYFVYDSGKDQREIEKLVKNGEYENAINYIEEHYNKDTYTYYSALADVYEEKGDYDNAALSVLSFVDTFDELNAVNDSVISDLDEYKTRVSDDVKKKIDTSELAIEQAKAAAQKKAAEEKAAQEATKKKEAEEKAAKEAAEKKAAEEKAAKEASEKQAALEKKEAEEKAAREKAEKEEAQRKAAEEKNVIDNARKLGVDLVMESHNSAYEDKYFKTEGTVDTVKENAYLVRYLSTVANHKKMYKVWVLSQNTGQVYVGENIVVVGEYVGFAEDSSVPTIKEYKLDKSASSFYDSISNKAKIVNWDISFEDLLRYGEYQEYVYVEGEVFQVYENCLNMRDEYGNKYVIFDKRVNQTVILQGDYIRVYGSFDGIDKEGYVWPLISWLVDAY
jgi:hypothetical protein